MVSPSRRISRSIQTLTAGVRRIAGGDLSDRVLRVETHDEVQTLAEAFNAMTASLRRSTELRDQAAAELDALNRSLESRVQERTRELETLNAALNQANEELKELDRLKSNFLATVSHEFKTPLTSIKAFAEILHDELEQQEAPPEMRRFLKIIDSESDRLARLIKNVLDLSRIESGRMLWRMTDFPVSQVIDAAVDGLLPALSQKQIRLERELAAGEARLHADQDRIQEVLANVLDNAIQASAAGQRIVIGCRAGEGNGDGRPAMLRIYVRDFGHGIPPEHLEKIFDRFHQVSTHGRRRKGGTGLGLAISREITEHHGGRIWAESEPGRGSTFHIALPLAAAARPPHPAP
jgi:signal transduction histidine kinase